MPAVQEHVDFKLLFERSPGLYLVLDPELRIAAASDAYCRATHIRRDDVIGRGLFEVFTDNPGREGPNGVAMLRASLDRVLKTKRPDTMAIQRFDVARPPAEGGGFEEKYWNPRNSPILDDEGNVRWIIHRVYDVTNAQLRPDEAASQRQLALSQERLIIELQRMNAELSALDVMRSNLMNMARMHTVATMASALAHDVSQPLAAARNYLGVLKRDPAVMASQKTIRTMRNMEVQMDRAGDIVKDLRRFMSTGHMERRAANVERLVMDSLRLAQATAHLSGASLMPAIPAGLPDVYVNVIQIQQVLVNLVSNAIEADGGAVPRQIGVSAIQEGGTIAFRVKDNGPGLAPEISASMFEPFHTTKPDGLGIGLSICKAIVDEHGGMLNVEKTGPDGTTFVFTLPAANTAP